MGFCDRDPVMMRMRGVDVQPGNGIETEIVKLVQCLRVQWRTRTSSCGPIRCCAGQSPAQGPCRRQKGDAQAEKTDGERGRGVSSALFLTLPGPMTSSLAPPRDRHGLGSAGKNTWDDGRECAVHRHLATRTICSRRDMHERFCRANGTRRTA